jgi:hypothetical protein
MPTVTDKNFGKGKTKMSVGVHTKCTPDNAEVMTTKAGNVLFKAIFLNRKGEMMDKGIWVPNPDKPKVRDGEGKAEAAKREEDQFVDQLVDLLKPFYSAEQIKKTLSHPDNERFAKIASEMFNKAKGECNLIVQYDQDYKWAEFPKWNYIEAYEEGVPAFQPNDYHRMKKEGVSGGLASPTDDPMPASSQEDDDLPF